MAHARELGHTLEQARSSRCHALRARSAHRACRARPRAGALRHVAHIHDVRLAVHERRQPPPHIVPDHARGGLAGRAAVHGHPEHVRGIHDHHLDVVARARRKGLRLALVLCIWIGESEATAAVEVVLGADLTGRGRADAGNARGDHHTPNALGRRRLHRETRCEGVHSQTRSAGWDPTKPAQWNTVSQPRKARAGAPGPVHQRGPGRLRCRQGVSGGPRPGM